VRRITFLPGALARDVLKGTWKCGQNFHFTKQVLDGKSTLFWDDVWLGEIPLRLEFPKLFNYAITRSATIAEYWAGGEWIIPFRRTFGADDLVAWEQLMDKLRCVRLQGSKDYPIWILEKSGSYSTRSMYRFLSHRGVINKRMERLWNLNCR